jgi:hypothetical protein
MFCALNEQRLQTVVSMLGNDHRDRGIALRILRSRGIWFVRRQGRLNLIDMNRIMQKYTRSTIVAISWPTPIRQLASDIHLL